MRIGKRKMIQLIHEHSHLRPKERESEYKFYYGNNKLIFEFESAGDIFAAEAIYCKFMGQYTLNIEYYNRSNKADYHRTFLKFDNDIAADTKVNVEPE